jgi:hypothetical protein
MTLRLHLLAEFGVIINFAIEYDPKRTIFVGERLMAGFQIDDAKAAHGKACPFAGECTGIVGTAMDDLLVHLAQNGIVDRLAGIKMKDAADAAHKGWFIE